MKTLGEFSKYLKDMVYWEPELADLPVVVDSRGGFGVGIERPGVVKQVVRDKHSGNYRFEGEHVDPHYEELVDAFVIDPEVDFGAGRNRDVLKLPVDVLNLSPIYKETVKRLTGAETLGELVQVEEKTLMAIRSYGAKKIRRLNGALSEYRLSLGMKI